MNYEFEFSDVMDRVSKIIKSIEPHDSVSAIQNLVLIVFKVGQILSSHKVQINNKLLLVDR